MGQGYSMATLSAATATIDTPELVDLHPDKTISSARFIKSIRAKSQHGYVLVKALMKPYSTFDVSSYIQQITRERNALANIPNALGYQRIVESANGGFLLRQYVFSSVYDRLSTRPFVEDIEKRWLAYQLLCAIRDCHAQNLYHGDIKTENLLVTSWNWLYLTDFSAPFKPTHLPEDNPADFTFYFDTSSRRICYLAPERFMSDSTGNSQGALNWAMDMFSAGCAIAEIFLEGPIFTLSQIFKYKTGDYDPAAAHINKIDDQEVRSMILNMIDLDPEKRYSAEQHLSFYKAKIFPEYFYTFLHDYMHDLTDPVAAKPFQLDDGILVESDRKVDQIYQDFDKISYFLGYGDTLITSTQLGQKLTNSSRDRSEHEGTLLFLNLICAAIRNTAKSSARLKACDLLTAFALRLPDEAKLDRVLPYVAGLLNDESDIVRVAALHATTKILDSIQVVSPVNAFLAPEYIFVRLRSFLPSEKHKPSTLVRAAYASCLASLALSSARMLDIVQAIRADGRVPALSDDVLANGSSFQNLYDVARAEIVPFFEHATTVLITDPDNSVRRALLGSISRLCMFFGSTRTSDVVLSHLNTYLNEPDWILKCAFYDALVGVATYVGTSSLEQFILPIMIGSLTDPEHFVVEKVIRSFARMAALGLFEKSTLWELSALLSRFLVHPSIWLREAAAQFVEQACTYMSAADRFCIMLPVLQPFLRAPLTEFIESNILDKLKAPINRPVFDACIAWASRSEKSVFWTAASRDNVFDIGGSNSAIISANISRRFPHRIPPAQKDQGDQKAIDNLRNSGFLPDDEVKLIALREYILRYSQQKTEIKPPKTQELLAGVVSLAQLDVNPQNVFFDPVQPYQRSRSLSLQAPKARKEGVRTISDALLDASTTLDNPLDEFDNDNRHPRDSKMTPSALHANTDSRETSPRDSARPSPRVDSPVRGDVHVEIPRTTDKEPSSVSHRHVLLDPNRLSVERKLSTQHSGRSSASSLLGRPETMKADAATSTSQEIVFGKLDTTNASRSNNQQSLLSQNVSIDEKQESRSPIGFLDPREDFEAKSTYTGHDPVIIRLLNNHVVENAPVDLLDFGDRVTPIDIDAPIRTAVNTSPQAGAAAATDGQGSNKEIWRPSGQLLTQFAEHSASINRVAVAPDHAFFVTASDDGSCKIWDTARLEKNITARSRLTHKHADGSEVKSLCFVENTHTFVSGATDGSIHAVRIEIKHIEGAEVARYGRPVLVRDWRVSQFPSVPSDGDAPRGDTSSRVEYAVHLHHYRSTSSQSILLVATNHGRIIMVDMKTMSPLHVMQNPAHHGTPTTFCVDRRHHWLLLGTSHGILDLWDLRFKLRLRSFGLGGAGLGQRIDRLLLHPSLKGNGRLVIASCGGELSVWDIEKLVCKEVLRPASFVRDSTRKIKNYEVWHPDEESSEDILRRFASAVEADPDQLQPVMPPADSVTNAASGTVPVNVNLRSSQQAQHIPALYTFLSYRIPLLITAGTDRALRYWNLSSPEQSSVLSGPMLNVVGEENRVRPRYETSWPTSMSLSGLVMLVEERFGEASSSTEKEGTRTKQRQAGQVEKANASKKTIQKTPKNTMIGLAQQQMLRTHVDAIMDVAVLRKPYGCVVSVDRGGGLFVFY